MKKALSFATIAVLIASCSNQETFEIAQNNTIDFNTYVGKSSKADVTNSSIEDFNVYGGFDASALAFDGTVVTKSGNAWRYEGSRYWVPGETYTFAALSPAGSADNVTFNLESLKVTDYTPGDDDVVVAFSESIVAKSSDNDAVRLNFRHALTRVQFTFKNIAEVDADFEISDIKLSNVVNKGTLTVSYETGTSLSWSNSQQTAAYEYTLSGEKAVKYLLPQNLTDEMILTFKVTASVDGGEEKEETYSIPVKTENVTEWEMGHAYNYSIDLKLDEIIFDVDDIPGMDDEDEDLEGENKPKLLSADVKIDFGSKEETDDTEWNSITTANSSDNSLNDVDGNNSGLLLSSQGFTSYAGPGSEYNSPIEVANISWPLLVWKDSFAIEKGTGSGDSDTGIITITGFNSEQKFNIVILATRWNASEAARKTKFEIESGEDDNKSFEINQGFGSGFSTSSSTQWDAFDFNKLTNTFENIAPTSEGSIIIKVTGIDTGTRADAHISAVVISPIEE